VVEALWEFCGNFKTLFKIEVTQNTWDGSQEGLLIIIFCKLQDANFPLYFFVGDV
jgi:hypothetical protein